MNNTLLRDERLRKNADFDNVFKNGKKIPGSLLSIHYAYNETGLKRAGFIVSKKVSLRAVVRNRIKRILREIFRKNKDLLPESIDLAFRASPQSKRADYQDLEYEALKHFKMVKAKNTFRSDD